jgi:hypothetical protein
LAFDLHEKGFWGAGGSSIKRFKPVFVRILDKKIFAGEGEALEEHN